MDTLTSPCQLPKSIPLVSHLFAGYISDQFPKAFVWGINTVVDTSGQFVYAVELSDARNLYKLKLNLDGKLIAKEAEAMI